jgi:hypothetical protein
VCGRGSRDKDDLRIEREQVKSFADHVHPIVEKLGLHTRVCNRGSVSDPDNLPQFAALDQMGERLEPATAYPDDCEPDGCGQFGQGSCRLPRVGVVGPSPGWWSRSSSGSFESAEGSASYSRQASDRLDKGLFARASRPLIEIRTELPTKPVATATGSKPRDVRLHS